MEDEGVEFVTGVFVGHEEEKDWTTEKLRSDFDAIVLVLRRDFRQRFHRQSDLDAMPMESISRWNS